MRLLKKIEHYINRYRYRRTHRMLPDIRGDKSSGACGQDLLVSQLLGHKRNGVFMDIGANDGVTISNSLYFEGQLGWTGLAVEPIPAVFALLKNNRTCNTLQGCITPRAGKATFLEMTGAPNMLSTLTAHNTGLTARRIRKNARRQNAAVREIEVECFTFQSLIEKYQITEIDFLSIDTEGGELEILESIDFDQCRVRVVSVENNYFTGKIRAYMEQSGFLYVGTFKVDEIYVFGGQPLRDSLSIPQRVTHP